MKRIKLAKLLAIALCLIMIIQAVPFAGYAEVDDEEEATELIELKATEEIEESAIATTSTTTSNNNLRLWYTRPAQSLAQSNGSAENSRSWMSEVLPIGNGYMGGMIFGGVQREQIHFNEKTLWSGGPKSIAEGARHDMPPAVYNYGNRTTLVPLTVLDEFRELLDNKTTRVFGLNQGTGGGSTGTLTEANHRDNAQWWLIRALMYGASQHGNAWNFNPSGMAHPYDNKIGQYQDFGDVFIDFSRAGITNTDYTDYVRDLDIETAIASVSFTHDDVEYKREYFNSYPDNVLAMKLTASEPGMLTFDASVSIYNVNNNWRGGKNNINYVYSATSSRGVIDVTGRVYDNGLRFAAQVMIIPTGGSIIANGTAGYVSITGANEVTILLACGTDYKDEPNVDPMQRWYRSGIDPQTQVNARNITAAAKGYDALLNSHLDDYQNLFSRVDLWLGEDMPDKPTDEIVRDYRENAMYGISDTGTINLNARTTQANLSINTTPGLPVPKALEALYYQYGRYLSIASSRAGSLPANLVGVWQIGTDFWNGDYHMNQNFQMNYWPQMAANLAETVTPMIEFHESLRAPGRIAAGASLGVPSGPGEENGSIVHTATSPFGLTGPYQVQEFGWNVGGMSYSLTNAWEYYRFTGDTAFLSNRIYPMLKEQATLYDNLLWWSPYQQRLVVSPSHSPEQGPVVNGTTYDQSVAWEAFEQAIQAAEILGVDEEEVIVWRDKQAQLFPIQIGESGQIKEWFEESRIGYAKAGTLAEEWIWNFNAGFNLAVTQHSPTLPHRHMSHMVGLYPGTLINKDTTPAAIDAAKVSLGNSGFISTGWGKGHRLPAWARTGEGERAYEMVQASVGGRYTGALTNLFNSHGGDDARGSAWAGSPAEGRGLAYQGIAVWQIDGNFGYTAGVNEMLLQSHLGYTQFLPAIPEAWDTGSVSGLVARGNFVIDMDWSDGGVNYFKVNSRIGGKFIGEYPGISTFKLIDSSGNNVAYQVISNDKISFNTVVGETYTMGPAMKVSFKANGGVGSMPDYIALPGENYTLPANTFSRENHNFYCWNTTSIGNGVSFSDGGVLVNIREDITLYALWIRDPIIKGPGPIIVPGW